MTWLSIHFYPKETQDVFLVRALKPFLEQYIWPKRESRAFFIRYQDEKGPHVRVRLRGEAEWLEEMIRPAMEGWFAGRGTWEEQAYQAEPERFGGDEGLAWAEEYFHVSTRVVLDRMSREQFTYGDAMFDALRMHLIALYAGGLSRERARRYCEQLYSQWQDIFLPSDDAGQEIRNSFEGALKGQKEQLHIAVDAFWKTLKAGKFDAGQPEWLRWMRGNELILKGLEGNLEKALPSLLHLTNNRLGINNQDEVYLLYILSETL